MHGSLFEGDQVLINKLAYGARLPITPLSFKFGGKKKYLNWIELPYMRFFGFSEIKRNDVIAFNFSLTGDEPIDIREEYIKRCVAIAGDTLKIVNGKVFVNSESNEPANIYNNYVVVANEPIDTNALKKLNIIFDNSPQNNLPAPYNYNFFMSAEQAGSLFKIANIKSITLKILPADFYNPAVFPNYSSYPWNQDHFGPLFIPGEEDSILLSKENLYIYQRIIEKYENAKLEFKHDSVFVDGEHKLYYTFTQNYYFVMGDNRSNSIDSRNWGFIPESHIIGKASYIIYSSEKEGRRFNKVN